MRLEVALLSIPFAFCLSLFALRASIATRSSKGVSLSLRTIAYPFFICKSSLSFFLSILYQKGEYFSNVRKCRWFKSGGGKKPQKNRGNHLGPFCELPHLLANIRRRTSDIVKRCAFAMMALTVQAEQRKDSKKNRHATSYLLLL